MAETETETDVEDLAVLFAGGIGVMAITATGTSVAGLLTATRGEYTAALSFGLLTVAALGFGAWSVLEYRGER